MKPRVSIIGVWIGALLVSFPVAAVMLYLLTGKVALPECLGGGLHTPADLAADLERMAQEHEEAA